MLHRLPPRTRRRHDLIAGVGAALAVAGFFVLPGDNDVVRVSVVPTANGVGFAGVFP